MLILDIFTVNLFLFKGSYKMKKRTSKRIYSILSFIILCNFIICSFLVFEYLGEIYFFNGVFKRIQDILHVVNVHIRGKALAENFCQGFFIAKIEFQCYNQNGMYVR